MRDCQRPLPSQHSYAGTKISMLFIIVELIKIKTILKLNNCRYCIAKSQGLNSTDLILLFFSCQ